MPNRYHYSTPQAEYARLDELEIYEDMEESELGCGSHWKEMLRTSWVGRAVETMQIRWWHMRTGFHIDEREVSENDYRRDERMVAISEVSS